MANDFYWWGRWRDSQLGSYRRSRTTHYNSITTEMIGSKKGGKQQKEKGELKFKKKNG